MGSPSRPEILELSRAKIACRARLGTECRARRSGWAVLQAYGKFVLGLVGPACLGQVKFFGLRDGLGVVFIGPFDWTRLGLCLDFHLRAFQVWPKAWSGSIRVLPRYSSDCKWCYDHFIIITSLLQNWRVATTPTVTHVG
jgi:hypothetical protein